MSEHHHHHARAATDEPKAEGRFEIIDDRIRAHGDNESEDDMDDDSISGTASMTSADQPHQPKRQASTASKGDAAAAPERQGDIADKENIPHAMSRFKLVHVDARFHRGRWKCWDYMEDEKAAKAPNEQAEIELEKPKSSTQNAPATEAEKAAVKFCVGGTIDEEATSPRAIQVTATRNESLNSEQVAQASNSDWLISYLTGKGSTPAVSPAVNGSNAAPSWPSASASEPVALSLNDQNLDTKIQQAMDLVKTHLMFAVHEEVNTMRAQLAELRLKEQQLMRENMLLRAHATSETLAKLDELHLQQPVSTAPPIVDDARQRSHTSEQ